MADIFTHDTLKRGLVSYWDMEEASGVRIDRHFTNHLTDNATVTQDTGKLGNAAQFTSANSEFLEVGDNTSLSITGDLSISLWAYFDSAKNVKFVSKRNDTNSRSYMFEYENSSTQLGFYVSDDGTGGNETSAQVSWTASTDTWYHLVAVYDASAGEVDFYVDGSQQGTTQTGMKTSIFDSSGDFNVGQSGTAGDYMDGRIDELGIWDKELTSTEVTDLYNGGTPLPFATKTAAKFVAASTTNLTVPDSASLSFTSTGTWEMWVKLLTAPTSGNQMSLLWKGTNGAAQSWNLQYYNDSGTMKYRLNIYDDAADTTNQASDWTGPDLVIGEWTHVAFTFDPAQGNEAELFIDGVSQGEQNNDADDIDDNTGLVYIGVDDNSTRDFDGEMCEIRIWDDVRTQAEITANARVELVGNEAGLVAYWRMNDYTRLLDLTSNDNDITVNNNNVTWVVDHPFRADNSTENTHSIDLELSSSQYLSVPDASLNGADFSGDTDFSAEAWVKIEQLPSTAASEFHIINRFDGSDSASQAWRFFIDTSDKLNAKFEDDSNNSSQSVTTAAVFAAADVGVWVHVAVVVNVGAGSFIFYKNGEVAADTQGAQDATAITTESADLGIGSMENGAGYMDGKMSDVRLWTGQRSATEIRQNMGVETPIAGSDTLVGHWKLQNDLTDSSGNGQTLTNNNSAEFSVDRGFNYDTFYTDPATELTSVDGYANSTTDAVWATIHDHAGEGAGDSDASIRVGTDTYTTTDWWSAITRGILVFDTSALPSEVTVQGANFVFTNDDSADEQTPALGATTTVDIVVSAPASDTAVVAGDYNSLGSTVFGQMPFDNVADDALIRNVIPLNSQGLANISLSDVSPFGMRTSWDTDDVAPTWESDKGTALKTVYMSDHGSMSMANRPRLEVSHVTAATSTNNALSMCNF